MKLKKHRYIRIFTIAFLLAILIINVMPAIPQFQIIIPLPDGHQYKIGYLYEGELRAAPADCYWVGDAGNWSDDTSHWATSSGGSPGGGNKPDSSSNTHFDGNSISTGSQTITVNETAYCANMDWTGISNSPTFTVNNYLYIYGTLTATSGVTLDSGSHVIFSGSGNVTWFTVGSVEGGYYDGEVHFAGTYTLQNTLDIRYTIGSGACGNYYDGDMTLTSGTLDLNGQDVYCGTFTSSNSNSRTLTMSTGTFHVSDWDCSTSTNMTLNCNTSEISMERQYGMSNKDFDGGGLTYYDITFTQGYTQNTGEKTWDIVQENTFHDFTVTSTTADNTWIMYFNTDQTINNDASFAGYNQSHRFLVCSNTFGTPRQLTVNGDVTADLTDFRDIQGTPSTPWDLSSTDSGNLGGNFGITFNTPQNNYWVGNSGSWSDTNHWASTSGGTAGSGRIPVAGVDTAVFDENSITYPLTTVTFDIQNVSAIDATDVTNTPTFSGSTVYIYGDVIEFGTITYSITNTYFGGFDTTLASSSTMTTSMYVQKNPYTMNSLYLNGNVTVAGTVTLSSGVFNLNDYNLTASYFNSSTTTYARILRMGSGTLTLNGTGATTKWNVASTNLTIYCETSTLILTNSGSNGQSFTGAGKTYYDLQIAGAGDYTLTFNDANTWHDMLWDRSSAHKTLAGNYTQTITGNIFSPLNSTVTITISNVDVSKSSGTVVLDYLAFTSGDNTCVASGGATFYAGVNSTGSPQTGWNFSSPTAPTITSSAATLVTRTTATLNGNLTSLGGYGTVEVYFHYGVDETLTSYSSTAPMEEMTGTGTYSAAITGLASETIYYFQAVASDGYDDLASGTILNFTTTGAPIVDTLDATEITTNGATLNGSLVDLGDYDTVYVRFEYGLTTSYGTYTTEETLTEPASFEEVLTGLLINETYHYRAIGRYVIEGNSYNVYGDDEDFTTNTQTITKIYETAAVFTDYLTTGDMLITAEIICEYSPYYPVLNPERYFQVRLVDTDDTTVLAATTLKQWGDRPEAIYLNPTVAATLTEGTAYRIQLVGIFDTPPDTESYTLTDDDWYGSDLNNLDKWCISTATSMELYDEIYTYTKELTDTGTVITDDAGGYFTTGIPGIAQVRPDLFSTSQQKPAVTTMTQTNAFDDPTAWTTNVGTRIATDAGVGGNLFNISGKDFLSGFIMLLLVGVVIFGVSQTNGYGGLGFLLFGLPLVYFANEMKIISIVYTVVFAIIMFALFVRQFFIKTL